MQYNGPFDQPGSPDASYTNGNVNIGLQGSVPAAGAIEYPQREVVNFITDSGLTPTNADLQQLGEAVQAAKVAFAVDVGTSGSIVINLVPEPPFYQAGLVVRVLIGNDIPGPTTINVNGLGNVATVFNGQPLFAGILLQGDVGEFIDDGTKFQLIGGARGIKNILTLDTVYYVDPVHGNDLNNGLMSTSAWATLNHAYSFLQRYVDFAGHTVTVNCLFPNSPTAYATMDVAGGIVGVYTPDQLQFIGDVSGFECQITIGAANASAVIGSSGAMFRMTGFALSASGSGGQDFVAAGGAQLEIGHCVLSSAGLYGLGAAGSGSSVTTTNVGPITFSGSFASCIIADANAEVNIQSTTFNFNAAASSAVFTAITLGTLSIGAVCTFNVSSITGHIFLVASNGVIDTNSNTGYLPGSLSGIQTTGGQIV